jgi:hypothetical protein
MKTVLIYGILFLAGSNAAFSQLKDSLPASLQINPSLSLIREDYLKKSRNQKTTGIVLGVGGAVLATAGLGIAMRNIAGIFDPNDPPKNEKLGDVLGYSGLGLMVASVPFLISGAMNRKKAFHLFLENNTTIKVHNGNVLNISSPAFTLKLGL